MVSRAGAEPAPSAPAGPGGCTSAGWRGSTVDWAGAGADGARFLDDHPYARDLDLFGRGSLFQLLNTARTEAGEETLADWFKRGAGRSTKSARGRPAVDELQARQLDFREDLAVLAAEGTVSRTGSRRALGGVGAGRHRAGWCR